VQDVQERLGEEDEAKRALRKVRHALLNDSNGYLVRVRPARWVGRRLGVVRRGRRLFLIGLFWSVTHDGE
jgi:hypothetical protein